MDLVRLACYGIGFLGAVGMAFVLLRVRVGLGRLLAVVMIVWAIICASLSAMLLSEMYTGDLRPDWADWMWLVDSLLLAVMPVVLYIQMWRNGHARSG